jgi:hypothetical protein
MNKKICSICGKQYEGYGNNAQPISNDKCCDMCYHVFVLRYKELGNAIISAKERDKIVPITKTLTNGVHLEYLEEYSMLTDYKKVFIREFKANSLNDAISKLEVMYDHYIICDWNYVQLTEQYTELINTI